MGSWHPSSSLEHKGDISRGELGHEAWYEISSVDSPCTLSPRFPSMLFPNRGPTEVKRPLRFNQNWMHAWQGARWQRICWHLFHWATYKLLSRPPTNHNRVRNTSRVALDIREALLVTLFGSFESNAKTWVSFPIMWTSFLIHSMYRGIPD